MIEYKNENDRLVCVFQGRMDTITAMKLENEVDINVRKAKKPVVFDLAGVDYVSSSFIRLCLRAAKCAGHGNFRIANAPDFVRKLFAVVGLKTVDHRIDRGPAIANRARCPVNAALTRTYGTFF